MRPASLLSVALCGVLWTSLNFIVNAVGLPDTPTIPTSLGLKAPQTPANPIFGGGDGTVTGGASGSSTTDTTTTPSASSTLSTLSTLSASSAPLPTQTSPSAAIAASDSGTAKTSSPAKARKTNTGAIVGGIVGGIIVIGLIGLAFHLWRRRRKSSPPRDAFTSLEKNRASSSPSVHPTPPPHAISYDAPVSAPPQSTTSGEARALMSGYPETQPSGAVVPVVGAQKPYVTGTIEREVDEDGVSLRSPSPTVPEEGAEQGRDFVPRLPIYNRSSDESPHGPAL